MSDKSWTCRQQATGTWCVEDDSTVAHVYGRNAEKRAKVISAAPDLLVALEAMLPYNCATDAKGLAVADQARAAIAKAKP